MRRLTKYTHFHFLRLATLTLQFSCASAGSILLSSLAFLPGAVAQPGASHTAPCGSRVNPHEIFIEIDTSAQPLIGNVDLTVYGQDGVPITTATLPNGTPVIWPITFSSTGDCDLVVEGDDHNDHADFLLNVQNLPDDVVIFEMEESGPGVGSGGEVYRFAWGTGKGIYPPSHYNFYAPYNDGAGNQDFYVEVGGEGLRG